MVKIEDFYKSNLTVLNNIPTDIQESEWFESIADLIDNTIELDYFNYYFLPRIIEKTVNGTDNDSVVLIQRMVRNLLIKNKYKYQTLFNTTNLEYNPIWNVDGTETLEYSREIKNTGTQGNTGSNNLTDSFNSIDSNDRTESLYKTTFNSSSENLTDKTIENDSVNHRGSNTHNTQINNTRTDNLTENESYSETKSRGGNIGVTMTQQLIEAERNIADFSFLKIVCKDIVGEICLLV